MSSYIRYICSLLLLAGLSLGVSPARAIGITVIWDSPTMNSGPSEVLNTGTYVDAVMISTAVPTLTLNGVTFHSDNHGAYSGHIDIQWDGEFSGVTTPSFVDSDYNTFMNSGAVANPGNFYPVIMTGLTAGANYRVQFWTPAWNDPYPTTLDAVNTVDLGNTGVIPTWTVGYFTAFASTASFDYYGTGGNYGLVAGVSLFQMSAIPEPSTYAALAGLAGLGLAVLRKRRQNQAAAVVAA
jgi:hypothetical protein